MIGTLLGDAIRKFAHPDAVYTGGILNLIWIKVFWLMGPQVITYWPGSSSAVPSCCARGNHENQFAVLHMSSGLGCCSDENSKLRGQFIAGCIRVELPNLSAPAHLRNWKRIQPQ